MTTSHDLLLQYQSLTGLKLAGVAHLTGRTLLEVTGADRASLLHSFCTNEVKQLALGRGCEAFVTSPQGKILGHVWIFNAGPSLLVETVPGQAERLISHWNHYVISEDVTFRDLTSQTAALLVAGRDAPSLLSGLCNQQLPHDIPSLATPMIGGHACRLCVIEYVGSPSFLLLADRAAADDILAKLQQAGAERCSPEAVEMARIEQGFPLYGKDITDDNLPQEIGRDTKAISFTKGCYLGQETVARIDALGHVNRLLAGVRFACPDVPATGTKLMAADKEVGHVTSAVWSPRLAAPLAIALLRRAQAKAGTQLTSSAGPAEVVTLPVTSP